MSYNAKNYTEQGGAVTHVDGTLVFGDGAKIKGFPGGVNVPDTTGNATANAAVIKALLISLKDAGIIEGDAWNVSISSAELHNLPTSETAFNTGKATVTIDGTDITITLSCKVSELKDADHGEAWGVHKWLGFGVTTGLGTSVAGVVFDDGTQAVTLTAADDSEASDVGLSTGDFILYIKAENVFANGGQSFVLSGLGKEPTTYTMKVVEG